MAATRIAIVGGGSFQWGPLFARDLLATEALAGSTLVLHDVDPVALDLVHRFASRLAERHERPFAVEQTTDLDEALRGAGFVVLTITTGGLETMRADLEIPAKYGIHQTVGDTVGPGGLSRALRSIPAVLEIARRVEAVCPDAWFLNYTNPMTTLCRAVARETRLRTVGLCHELIGVLRRLERLFEVDLDEIRVRAGGINHLLWILEMSVGGEDAFPRLAELARDFLSKRDRVRSLDPEQRHGLMDHWLVKSRLLQVYGALPAAGDRHLVEFFPHFLGDHPDRGRAWGVEPTRVEERYAWRKGFEGLIRGALDGSVDTAPYMARISDEAAGRIVAALASGRSYHGIVNLPNRGQIENLPRDAVVETFGVLDATGAHGIAVGPLPPAVASVVRRHVDNQEAIVEAALQGDRALALQALLADPLVGDLDAAEPMLDELLETNRAHLPQFFA